MIVSLRLVLGGEGGGGNDGGGGDGSGLDGQTIVVVIAEMMIEIHMRCRWRVELSERGVVRPTCTVLFTHTHRVGTLMTVSETVCIGRNRCEIPLT